MSDQCIDGDLHFYFSECHEALLIDEGEPAGWAATTCLSKILKLSISAMYS